MIILFSCTNLVLLTFPTDILFQPLLSEFVCQSLCVFSCLIYTVCSNWKFEMQGTLYRLKCNLHTHNILVKHFCNYSHVCVNYTIALGEQTL